MREKFLHAASAILLATVISGCVTKPDKYYWGSYESLIYDMYILPGNADANTQIQKLNTDISQANSLGKPVPPGVYAHLGFMYAVAGEPENAISAFNTEKANYPESSTLIDGIMQRAKVRK